MFLKGSENFREKTKFNRNGGLGIAVSNLQDYNVPQTYCLGNITKKYHKKNMKLKQIML